MKKIANVDSCLSVIKAPAYLVPGNRLFETLGAAVADAFGYPLKHKELARLMGQGERPPAVGSVDSIIRTWFPGAACLSS